MPPHSGETSPEDDHTPRITPAMCRALAMRINPVGSQFGVLEECPCGALVSINMPPGTLTPEVTAMPPGTCHFPPAPRL